MSDELARVWWSSIGNRTGDTENTNISSDTHAPSKDVPNLPIHSSGGGKKKSEVVSTASQKSAARDIGNPQAGRSTPSFQPITTPGPSGPSNIHIAGPSSPIGGSDDPLGGSNEYSTPPFSPNSPKVITTSKAQKAPDVERLSRPGGSSSVGRSSHRNVIDIDSDDDDDDDVIFIGSKRPHDKYFHKFVSAWSSGDPYSRRAQGYLDKLRGVIANQSVGEPGPSNDNAPANLNIVASEMRSEEDERGNLDISQGPEASTSKLPDEKMKGKYHDTVKLMRSMVDIYPTSSHCYLHWR